MFTVLTRIKTLLLDITLVLSRPGVTDSLLAVQKRAETIKVAKREHLGSKLWSKHLEMLLAGHHIIHIGLEQNTSTHDAILIHNVLLIARVLGQTGGDVLELS